MIKKRLPLKKEHLLIAGTLLLLWICYQMAFKKTLDAMQLHSKLSSTLNEGSELSYQPGYLQRKSRNLDEILKCYKVDSLSLRGNILSNIARIAEKEQVRLSEVPEQDPLFNNNHFIVQRLDFEGEYSALLRTLQALEKSEGIGITRSIQWKVVDKTPGNHELQKQVLEVCFEMSK